MPIDSVPIGDSIGTYRCAIGWSVSVFGSSEPLFGQPWLRMHCHERKLERALADGVCVAPCGAAQWITERNRGKGKEATVKTECGAVS